MDKRTLKYMGRLFGALSILMTPLIWTAGAYVPVIFGFVATGLLIYRRVEIIRARY